MMVARIAYSRLNARTKAQVDKLLALPIPPADISRQDADFVRAAAWADEVRGESGFGETADWHFIDNPFAVNGAALPTDLPKKENIVTALNSEVSVLRSATASPADRARALRFLIHFVGDIHQPLHCATRVSPLFPEGDRGGNDFSIALPGEAGSSKGVKLHSYWDEGFRTFPPPGKDFAPSAMDLVDTAAKQIEAEDPASDRGWKTGGDFAFSAWMGESDWLAKNFVYTGLKRGYAPSESYVREGTRIVRKRVAWAGYRLAALLNAIYSTR